MRIASVRLRGFKRFADLTIKDLPASARLVVLAGPNGFGKSSLFDAFQLWAGVNHGLRSVTRHDDYYDRPVEEGSATGGNAQLGDPWAASRIALSFHGHQQVYSNTEQARKAFHVRSAYRNEPELAFGGFTRLGSLLEERRPQRMIEADPTASANYARLVSDAFDDAFEEGIGTLAAWRERTIGELRDAMARLFPGLSLNGLGSPMRDPTLRFTKGRVRGFAYTSLSGGERAALDLLLDLIVKRRDYDATVYCIDEPELHLNPRVHGAMLSELVALIPPGCQLWVATHAVGMLRRARDVEVVAPGSVAFLDFEERDFDAPVELRPVPPTRRFWQAALRVALDDLADLVAPRLVVVCEGTPKVAGGGRNADYDATCYNAIFADELPDVQFLSGGNSHDVKGDRLGFIAALPSVAPGIRVRHLLYLDGHAPEEVAELEGRNDRAVRVLSRRHMESYLYDAEVLAALCELAAKPEATEGAVADVWEALAEGEVAGRPPDDVKAAAGTIYNRLKVRLELDRKNLAASDARAFAKLRLVPLLKPGMAVYEELKVSIFGDRRAA